MRPAVVIAVRVTPRSSREAIEDVDDSGELRVRVMAPPADGAANAAVVKLVAKSLGVPRGAVSIVTGQGSRHKRLRVEGIGPVELGRRWPGLGLQQR